MRADNLDSVAFSNLAAFRKSANASRSHRFTTRQSEPRLLFLDAAIFLLFCPTA